MTTWLRVIAGKEGVVRIRDNFGGRQPQWDRAGVSKVGDRLRSRCTKANRSRQRRCTVGDPAEAVTFARTPFSGTASTRWCRRALLSNGRLSQVSYPVCHGLERDSASIHAILTTVPSRAEVRVHPLPPSGAMRGSHGLPPSWLGPIGKGFGGKPCHTYRLKRYVPHASDVPEANF